jgi:hypothetical protein
VEEELIGLMIWRLRETNQDDSLLQTIFFVKVKPGAPMMLHALLHIAP